MSRSKASGASPAPVRMRDVARDLGVSVMAVSKALRNAPDISTKLKRLVRKRCEELGYHPNVTARALTLKRTFAVGLIIPNLSHSFFADVAKGIAHQLHERGYTLVLANSEGDASLERRQVEAMLSRQVDGIILASVQAHGDISVFRRIAGHGVPAVLVDRDFPKSNLPFFGADNEAVGYLGTSHLLDTGRHRIAYIGSSRISTGWGRLQGYLKCLSDAGAPSCPGYVAEVDRDGSGYEGMRRLLALRPRPDGVFCFNDPAAVGAMKAILDAGLAIPGDIALAAAGNMRYSDALRVPLTTIDLNCEFVGERAAICLADMMAAGRTTSMERVLMPLKLIVRESSCAKA